MTTIDPWLVTAVHETAHCIAYLHFGRKFGAVRIWQDDDGEIVGSVTAPAGRYDCLMRAICCLSGPAAEERLTGVSADQQDGSSIDLRMAFEALARMGAGTRLDLDGPIAYTRSMIAAEWPVIEFIARALIAHQELSCEQVVALLEG